MKIVLVDIPVHIPTVMPYSLAMMKSVLTATLDEDIVAIDLNARYHYEQYMVYYMRNQEGDDFFTLLDEFDKESMQRNAVVSRTALNGMMPEGFAPLIKAVIDLKPDVVGISITYNSQIYFANSLIAELTKLGVRTVVGGPGDYSKLQGKAVMLPTYSKFIDYLIGLGALQFPEMRKPVLDFSFFDRSHYLTRELIYPLRTSISCPYKRCTFCTHHGNAPYSTIDLSFVRDSIVANDMKKVCFIDDDIPVPRLKEIAEMIEPLGVEWWCQLRPTLNMMDVLPRLRKAGLKSAAWGVESGSQRVLDMMEKGTHVHDVEAVLRAAHRLGITNTAYILFGLPGETKEDFMETIAFLERNAESIDLVSPTVFGLQRGSRIFNEPKRFNVAEISLTGRTYLSEKIAYTPTQGLTHEEAKVLKKKQLGRINRISKVPKAINSCKEQMLNY